MQLVQVLEGLHLALVQQGQVVLRVVVDLAVAQVVQHQQGVAAPSLQLHPQLVMMVEPLLSLPLVKRLVPLILEAPQLAMAQQEVLQVELGQVELVLLILEAPQLGMV